MMRVMLLMKTTMRVLMIMAMMVKTIMVLMMAWRSSLRSAKQSPLINLSGGMRSHLSGDCFTYHIGEGRGWRGLCRDGAADRSGDGAVLLAVSFSLQTHASGVLGFSFACGRSPHAKLNPKTERSYLKSLVLCRHMQTASWGLAWRAAEGHTQD